ncbi:uncharacterized protein RAG0_14423 [Rhynchosporium agropyri]|uniref:Uncharacterized protein n=1 Tax=Rhynchosporium agropyri TaxID=914238 RepID=A0A1E1LJ14_9HELO|nr:uncharacterized protein RAG0_14423 [Rhynchosporium agropyri]
MISADLPNPSFEPPILKVASQSIGDLRVVQNFTRCMILLPQVIRILLR